MTNAVQFEIVLLRKGKTKKDIANVLGISLQALYNKLNNVVDFKTREVNIIVEYLKLTIEEMMEIFFAHGVE